MNKKITLFIESNSEELLEDIVRLIDEHYGYNVTAGFEETVEEDD